jgi:hypothetical protein
LDPFSLEDDEDDFFSIKINSNIDPIYHLRDMEREFFESFRPSRSLFGEVHTRFDSSFLRPSFEERFSN